MAVNIVAYIHPLYVSTFKQKCYNKYIKLIAPCNTSLNLISMHRCRYVTGSPNLRVAWFRSMKCHVYTFLSRPGRQTLVFRFADAACWLYSHLGVSGTALVIVVKVYLVSLTVLIAEIRWNAEVLIKTLNNRRGLLR